MPKKHAKKPTVTRKQKIAAVDEKIQAPTSFVSGPEHDVEYLEDPVKSDCDTNVYRAMKLSNGLKVLLISDPTVAKRDKRRRAEVISKQDEVDEANECQGMHLPAGTASCRLMVDAGPFSDPHDAPCVSRILGDILLKASQKYPTTDRLASLIGKSGGELSTSNQDSERTEFYFQVSEVHFLEAIDRFVECFVEPLLTIKAVAKKREYIELEKKLVREARDQAGGFAKSCVLESIASRIVGHPGSNFGPRSMANLRSQTDEKYFEEVTKFMKRHYSAHRMTLVMEGRLPLDTMESYARTYFTKIPNNGLPQPDYKNFSFTRCFDHPEFRMIHRINSHDPLSLVKNMNGFRLELNWPVPSPEKMYRSKPYTLISRLINYKKEGSLFFHLREKGWCRNIACDVGEDLLECNSVFGLMTVTLLLTDDGRKNRKRVIKTIFSYINFIRREGLQKRYYDDMKNILQANFRLVPEKTLSRIPNDALTDAMLFAPSSEYLTAHRLLFEHDKTFFERFLDLMSPEKTNILVYDAPNDPEDDDAVFGKKTDNHTPHRIIAIPKNFIDDWKTVKPLAEFKFPESNPYVCDDYELVDVPENSPDNVTKIYSDDIATVWYKVPMKIRTKRCNVVYSFCSPAAGKSAETAFMMDLLETLLKTGHQFSAAGVAGFRSSIQADGRRLLIVVTGYSKKALLVAKDVVRYAQNFAKPVTEDLFETGRKRTLHGYSVLMREPQALAIEIANSITSSHMWTAIEKNVAGKTVDRAKFRDFVGNFMKHVRIDCLAYGNFTRADVIENTRECVAILRCKVVSTNLLPRPLIREIPRGTRCCRYKTSPTTSVETTVINYYQFADNSIKNLVTIKMIYIFVLNLSADGRIGLTNCIGPELIANHYDGYGYSLSLPRSNETGKSWISSIDRKIETFRLSWNEMFRRFTPKQWKEMKDALVRDLNGQRDIFDVEWTRYVDILGSQSFAFDKFDREIKVLEAMTVRDLRKNVLNLTSVGPEMRKLTVQAVGRDGISERDGKTSCSGCNCTPPKLVMLENLPGEEKQTPGYYITDVDEFKRGLATLPFLIATEVDDVVEGIRKDCNVH